MFAVMIAHPMRPGLLGAGRAEFDAASRPWHAFLRAQPGFREYLVLGDPAADRMVALSLWESEDHFRAAFAHPDLGPASAPLMALAAAPAAPETFEVLAQERG